MPTVDLWELEQRQALPLETKERLTAMRIEEWHKHWGGKVYVAFSGGKDSTVLLHQVRRLYPQVDAVFFDSGIEFPEVRAFVKSVENVTWLKPVIPFREVIEKHGYPVVSKKVARQINDIQNPTPNNVASRRLYLDGIKKDGSKTKSYKLPAKWRALAFSDIRVSHKCCGVMKVNPFSRYSAASGNRPYIGTMASESRLRKQAYLRAGCNSFPGGRDRRIIRSTPMAFWTDADVWEYIHKHGLKYSEIYDMGEPRTGCMFCMFGVHLEASPNRFQRMEQTHPKHYRYCMDKLKYGRVLDFIGADYGRKNEQGYFNLAQ